MIDRPSASHHHWFLNNIIHGSGGSGVTPHSYGDLVAGNEIYDQAGVNPCGTSALAGLTISVPNGFNATLPLDTQTFKMQILDNVVHDSGMTAMAIANQHPGTCGPVACLNTCQSEQNADGNGTYIDIDQSASPGSSADTFVLRTASHTNSSLSEKPEMSLLECLPHETDSYSD